MLNSYLRGVVILAALVLSSCSSASHNSSQPEAPAPATETKGHNHNQIDDRPFLPLDQTPSNFDAEKYELHFAFSEQNLTHSSYDAEEVLTFRALKDEFYALVLGSAGLDIKTVELADSNEPLKFNVDSDHVSILLNDPASRGDRIRVRIRFHFNGSKGIYFRSESNSPRATMVFSQSEAEDSIYWFPSNPHPNDRALFESYITVPKDFLAVSNGALLETTEQVDSKTFHWAQKLPIPSYLFVLTAGVMSVKREEVEGLPVEYYAPKNQIENTNYSLRGTPAILEFFQKHAMGVPFPFEKYAQTVVPHFMFGGMENSSATTLTDRTVHDASMEPEESSDGLVAHEARSPVVWGFSNL